MLNAITIDVEEYFHPTEVQKSVGFDSWKHLPSRVEGQVFRILELLDKKNTKATFFILGWVAEQNPRVARAIVAAGHEVGCHSYAHELVFRMTPDQFREDTRRAVAAIEDACGISPKSYRAPSYSITSGAIWALEILVSLGFVQDSSIYPITHDRYGIPGYPRHAHIIQTPSGPIQEIPIATSKSAHGRMSPVGGGAYLRLLPYRYTAAGIRRMNQYEGETACIYFHPWEIDEDQPRLAQGLVSRWRTYTGLSGMYGKVSRLLTEFQFSSLQTVFAPQLIARPTTSQRSALDTGKVSSIPSRRLA